MLEENSKFSFSNLRKIMDELNKPESSGILARYLAENNECLAEVKKNVSHLSESLLVLQGQINVTMQFAKIVSGLFTGLVAIVAGLCIFIFIQLSDDVKSLSSIEKILVTKQDMNEQITGLRTYLLERIDRIENQDRQFPPNI